MSDREIGELQALRTEVIESQKARIDLLKFKLIAVAALGSVGLGINGVYSGIVLSVEYIIGIIPLACIYIDMLCYHNTIRILVIARYLYHSQSLYEDYMRTAQVPGTGRKEGGRDVSMKYLFEFEDYALYWSSIALSGLVMIYGGYRIYVDWYRIVAFSSIAPIVLAVVGALGVASASWFKRGFEARCEALDKARWSPPRAQMGGGNAACD